MATAKRRTVVDSKVKPIYLGARASRGNTYEKRKCYLCDRLAAYRGQYHVTQNAKTTVMERFMCAYHAQEIVKRDTEIRKITALPEYRKYLKHMSEWRALQDAGEQGRLL